VGFSPYYNPPNGKRLMLEHSEGPEGARTQVLELNSDTLIVQQNSAWNKFNFCLVF